MTSSNVPGAHVFDGIRIADFAWVGVGPNATMQMAFHGAEVIRVESSNRPDTFRSSGPRPPGDGSLDASAYFAKFNRGKRSVAINLAHPRGAEVAKRLIAGADIVTESFAPGFMERIGLSYDEVRKIKPDVIMCSMSMEGQTGPHAKFRGFGLTLQATAGITGVTGWP
ncbi:MAG: CoA transferase, partial [Chloroflexi bacterium]|nr:CoA transferase [Chloroflexota bacterium]